MACKEHKALAEHIQDMKTDIALIRQSLLGNDGKNDGMVDKVNKHDRYFYIVYGMFILVGFAIANIGIIK